MMNARETPSTRPYLVRALYEWCSDNGFTPYVAVKVDESVRVPRDHVKNGEIVLNISFDATSSLKLGNEVIEFKARFGGVAQDILIPLNRVIAIYSRESGQGMVFPLDETTESKTSNLSSTGTLRDTASETIGKSTPLVSITTGLSQDGPSDLPPPPNRPRPSLKRVK